MLHVTQFRTLAALASLPAWDEEARDGALGCRVPLLAVGELGEETVAAGLLGWLLLLLLLLVVQSNVLKGLLYGRGRALNLTVSS